MRNSLRVDGADMRGQRAAADFRLQRRNQAFQHHGGLAGTGYAGDNREPSPGNVRFQGTDGVDLRGG